MDFKPAGNGATAKQLPPDNDDSSDHEVEQLITFGREYFATDFPNPARVGCPSPEALQLLARSGELPGDELCDHLFGCSECFRAYRAELEASRAAALVVVASRWSEWRERLAAAFALKLAFALAGIVILLVVSGALWLAWRDKAIPAIPRTAQLQPQPSDTISSSTTGEQPSRNETPSEHAGKKTSVSPFVRRAPAPLLVVEADLDELVAMRDVMATSAEAKAITLRQARMLLKLTLPENSRPGVYHASIANTAGQPLRTQRVSSADGVNLRLEFDLSKLAAGSYHLRLARRGATPADYPVKIVTSE
ncbi:MAG: hypothetical protein MOB07_27390 [Acidobacteria bacterium]|nr:hypothetical protein [Acidobacteriota bacterium]